jgi:hypothetical protein
MFGKGRSQDLFLVSNQIVGFEIRKMFLQFQVRLEAVYQLYNDEVKHVIAHEPLHNIQLVLCLCCLRGHCDEVLLVFDPFLVCGIVIFSFVSPKHQSEKCCLKALSNARYPLGGECIEYHHAAGVPVCPIPNM